MRIDVLFLWWHAGLDLESRALLFYGSAKSPSMADLPDDHGYGKFLANLVPAIRDRSDCLLRV